MEAEQARIRAMAPAAARIQEPDWLERATGGSFPRLLGGVVLAPLAAWAVGVPAFGLFAVATVPGLLRGGDMGGIAAALLIASLRPLVFGALPAMLAAVLGHLLLATLRLDSRRAYAATGGVLGLGLALLLQPRVLPCPAEAASCAAWLLRTQPVELAALILIAGVLPGIGAGLAFRAVVVRR